MYNTKKRGWEKIDFGEKREILSEQDRLSLSTHCIAERHNLEPVQIRKWRLSLNKMRDKKQTVSWTSGKPTFKQVKDQLYDYVFLISVLFSYVTKFNSFFSFLFFSFFFEGGGGEYYSLGTIHWVLFTGYYSTGCTIQRGVLFTVKPCITWRSQCSDLSR